MGIEQALDRFQKMKRDRMGYIVYELYERGGKANLDEFRGSIATNYGIRRKTQDEYFEDLRDAGVIDMTSDKIRLLWSENEAKEWLEKQGIRTKSRSNE